MQHRHSCFENQATINKKAREMKRPYIMVHMMTSLDGRIDCPVMAQISGDEYYEALDELGKCSKLSGRVTAAWENSAVECEVSDVKGTVKGEESVNVAVKSDEYTIVMDTHGHLQWNNNTADGFPLLCIMSEDVTEEHFAGTAKPGYIVDFHRQRHSRFGTRHAVGIRTLRHRKNSSCGRRTYMRRLSGKRSG